MKEQKNPDYVFEVSWEVCNFIGGIYTVLSTKAKTLQKINKDHTIFIGPDLVQNNQYFKENATLLKRWKSKAEEAGFKVRVGRWNVPGKPIAILVDFKCLYTVRESIYGQMWKDFKVDSLHGYGDYDESCMFAIASAKIIENFYKFIDGEKHEVVAHFDEWTTGMGLLYIKKNLPAVTTVFTTHATSIGRSIAANNKPLYDFLHKYIGDQMARELNMESKHSIEKAAAVNADAFTTVSSITAKESNQLLGREPDVTPNGFEEEIVPTDEKYATCRISARKRLLQIVTALTGKKPADDSLLVATSGRNEYRNKGLDLYLDSLKRVAGQYDGTRNIIAFVLVPAWAGEAREDLTVRMKKGVNNASSLNDPFITHYLYNYNEDKIVNKIRDLNFENSPEDKVKVIYIPSYLKGNDGVVNIDYYDLLPGLDITVFPSYYEPWGYTPLESIAMGVPTITTSLSGFGMWVTDEVSRDPKNSGVYVLERNDTNYNEVASKIADILIGIADMKPKGYKTLSEGAKKTSQKALWSNFIQAYLDVYQKAIKTNKKNR